jgi:ABC-type spermidine/putrescine transport system permease subunit II
MARVGLVDTVLGLTLAHTIIALPLVVVNVGATLKGFDETLKRAAMAAGAGPWQTVARTSPTCDFSHRAS